MEPYLHASANLPVQTFRKMGEKPFMAITCLLFGSSNHAPWCQNNGPNRYWWFRSSHLFAGNLD